jgi:hypothetical protein
MTKLHGCFNEEGSTGLQSGRVGAEAQHTIGPEVALHLTRQPQQVQVGHSFAQGKGGLVHIEGPFEQHR